MGTAAAARHARDPRVNARRLGVLLTLAVLVVAAAFWLARPRTAPRDATVGVAVLPGLAGRLDAISGIRVLSPAPQPPVTLDRVDGKWRVRESAYPADAPRVKRLLVALGELKVIEAKTADPARYAALGVEDPTSPGATSVRLDLEGLGASIGLIVGHTSGTHGTFVRVAGQAQSFEARPGVDLGRTARDWLARGFLDIAAARIEAVHVERSGEPAWDAERPERTAAHFNVPNLAHGAELTNAGAADSSASAFGNLEFDEVRAAAAAGEKRHRTTLRSYDGLVVSLSANATGTEHWLALEARYDAALAARFAAGAPKDAPAAAQVETEAAELNATTAGHEYRVPAYRFDAIFRPRGELLRH